MASIRARVWVDPVVSRVGHRASLVIGSLLLVATPQGCVSPGIRTRGEQADAVSAWLQSHGHPISVDAEGFDDLMFLRPLLEGKRIVQLGENTHGTREYSLVKARIVRFLHQELGYGVLAFESDLYQCYDADLAAAVASPTSTLTSCAFGVWHTEEVLALFDYLRDTQRSARPLRLAGIDVQPIGNNKADRPRFLSSLIAPVDTAYAAEVFALDSTFLDVYARGGRARRAYFRKQDGQRMAVAYEHLASFLADNEAAILSSAVDLRGGAVGVARQTARSTTWYIRQQSAPTTRAYVEHRDQGMAENLMFLVDELHRDQKVIVWGHNFHLRHDNLAIPPDSSMFPDLATRTMGTWIHERYGDEVYTVGLYAYRGRAANNSGEVYEIEPATPGSLEALLHRVGGRALFAHLQRATGEPGTAWMDAPITARYNGTTTLSMVMSDQYNAILFIDEVTPRRMLY